MIASLFNKLCSIFIRSKSTSLLNPIASNSNQELYIGNIEYRAKPYELRKIFEEYGEIEYLKIIRDAKTKRSKGYGFVKYVNKADAVNLLKANSGSQSIVFRGRELKIAFAKDQAKD
jgi:RNA recognition motif-containing protein